MNLFVMESAIGSMIASLFSIQFKFFDTTINIGNLSTSIEELMGLGFTETGQYSTLWNMGTQLFNILKPVSISLLTLFFLMDMFTLMRDVNQISWERITMKVIKGFAVYACICNLPQLLSMIIGIVNNVYNSRGAISGGPNVENVYLASAIQEGFNDMNLLEEIVGMLVMFFMFAAYIGTAIAAVVSVFQRFFKLILLYGVSPIPVCLLTFQPTQQAGKRFFQVFVATLFEAILIYLLLQIYKLGLSNLATNVSGLINAPAGATSVLGFGIGISVYNALLTGGISICSGLARETVGATAF